MRVHPVLIFLLFTTLSVHAQKGNLPIRNKAVQVSICPGLGTNGLHPGSFNNYLSINLSSGYSASNILFELGLVSNLNVNRTKGLQIAGLSNITGGNAYGGLTREEIEKKKMNGLSPYLSGVQFSGLTNMVLGDVYGMQASGGLNINRGCMLGFQVAGIANVVNKYALGVQFSGLLNIVKTSFGGVQLAGFSNYISGEMGGCQISIFNLAGGIHGEVTGKRMIPQGMQIGLINISEQMNGIQVGLINYAQQSQGTQIGLINFYKNGNQTNVRDGTSIGLVNWGDLTYVSVYTNELYAFNYEISTGTKKNGRIKSDKFNHYITNALIFSHKAYKGSSWGFGYGFKNLLFNRSETPGQTESKFVGYGMDIERISKEKGNLSKGLSMLGRVKLIGGTRVAPKLFGVYCFTAISMNVYVTDQLDSLNPDFLTSTGRVKNRKVAYWPGLSFGLLFH